MTHVLTRLAARAAVLATLLLASAAAAQTGLALRDPFARLTPKAGAVYVFIQNHAGADDRLISASSPQAEMTTVMITTTKDGVSSMADVPEGLPIPAEGALILAPGGAHVMLMGLKGKFSTGDMIEVTLTFANSGPVTLTVPVQSTRVTPPGDVETPFDMETHN
jgi:copper(I)-binding protein